MHMRVLKCYPHFRNFNSVPSFLHLHFFIFISASSFLHLHFFTDMLPGPCPQLPVPCHDEHVDEKKNQNRYRKERCDVDGTDHQCVCRDQRVALRIGYAMPAHEHAVRIDAVRRTGHKSAVIFGFEYLEITQVRGLNDTDLIHLISDRPVEDRHGKCISGSHFIQIREQPGAWQAPVAGYDAVRALATDRQRRAGQVPDRNLEYRFIRTVIDRQRYVDLGDFNIPHNPGTVDIASTGFRSSPASHCISRQTSGSLHIRFHRDP